MRSDGKRHRTDDASDGADHDRPLDHVGQNEIVGLLANEPLVPGHVIAIDNQFDRRTG